MMMSERKGLLPTPEGRWSAMLHSGLSGLMDIRTRPVSDAWVPAG